MPGELCTFECEVCTHMQVGGFSLSVHAHASGWILPEVTEPERLSVVPASSSSKRTVVSKQLALEVGPCRGTQIPASVVCERQCYECGAHTQNRKWCKVHRLSSRRQSFVG